MDKIVASAKQVALDLKFIELFTGLSGIREKGRCQLKLSTVNNNLIELLQTSTDYAIKIIAAVITKANFEISYSMFTSFSQQMDQIAKNTSIYHKLSISQTILRNG